MKAKPGYLPTLDGWRALSVLAVILYHDSLYALGPFSTRWFQNYGLDGVDVFFGISGLLICSRLLEEEQRHGSITLSEFYIRRAFRILPPAYFYLLVLVVLRFLSIIPLMPKEIFAATFFYRNYSRFSVTPGHIDWYTAHFWSLAVEEHFYLILPSVFYFAPKRWRIPVLGAIACAVCAWRLYRQQTRPWEFLLQHTDTRLDALLVPAILAIFLTRPKVREWFTKIARWPVPAAVLFCLLTWAHLERLTPLAQSILIPLILLGTVLRPSG
ncbi:MAG: acyltransferase family protein, partial [Candidatus Acidiferrales bacterium]